MKSGSAWYKSKGYIGKKIWMFEEIWAKYQRVADKRTGKRLANKRTAKWYLQDIVREVLIKHIPKK